MQGHATGTIETCIPLIAGAILIIVGIFVAVWLQKYRL